MELRAGIPKSALPYGSAGGTFVREAHVKMRISRLLRAAVISQLPLKLVTIMTLVDVETLTIPSNNRMRAIDLEQFIEVSEFEIIYGF